MPRALRYEVGACLGPYLGEGLATCVVTVEMSKSMAPRASCACDSCAFWSDSPAFISATCVPNAAFQGLYPPKAAF